MHARDFLLISYFKRDHEKGHFNISPTPCAQSLFMDKLMKNKRGLELVTSLFEFQSMFTKVHFLLWPFESGNWKEN